MRPMFKTALMLSVVLGLGLAALAADEVKTVTLSGNVACGKCNLKIAGLKECQDVLVVTGEGAGQYFLVKNEALKTFGHTCQGQKSVKITGTVTEKDGKMWIAATKIEKAEG